MHLALWLTQSSVLFRSGTTPSTMSCVWPLRSTQPCSPRPLSTPRPTGRRWLRYWWRVWWFLTELDRFRVRLVHNTRLLCSCRSCLRPSTSLPCMWPSRLCCPCTLPAVPLVSAYNPYSVIIKSKINIIVKTLMHILDHAINAIMLWYKCN